MDNRVFRTVAIGTASAFLLTQLGLPVAFADSDHQPSSSALKDEGGWLSVPEAQRQAQGDQQLLAQMTARAQGFQQTANQLPIGYLDGADSERIFGWSVDPDNRAAVQQVEILVNGEVRATVLANQTRGDLVAAGIAPDGEHGYSVSTADLGLAPGTYTVTARSLDQQTGGYAVLTRSQTLTIIPANQLPIGYLDGADSERIFGWSVDPDNRSAVQQVEILVNGEVRATVAANQTRGDLVAAGIAPNGEHGYSISTAELGLTRGIHTVEARSLDKQTGAFAVLVGWKKLEILSGNQLPIGYLDGADSERIFGWSVDPDDPTGIQRVGIRIDGEVKMVVRADQPREDLVAAGIAPNGEHGFSISTAELGLTPGIHTVEVRSLDEKTGDYPFLIGQKFISIFLPAFGLDDLWGIKTIGADKVWDTYQGQGVTIAIVDSGVQMDHPAFASNIWINPGEIADNGIDDDENGFTDDIHGWNFDADTFYPDGGNVIVDFEGHGTHVAGIAAGAVGVAPKATIIPVQISGIFGTIPFSWLAKGIRYAADVGADIINLSLGWVSDAGSEAYKLIKDAVDYAQNLGSIIVAAAGNHRGYVETGVMSPADMPGVIAVGATDRADNAAPFSNYGSELLITAPGVDIISAQSESGYRIQTHLSLAEPLPRDYSDYMMQSGTSMAAPFVSGAIALILSKYPWASSEQVKNLLFSGADDLGTTGRDFYSGYGRLNIEKSLSLSLEEPTGP